MNSILQAQFQRVESALNNLIDSISSYNPSPSAASALIEADDELTQGLEQLTTHQSNHATLVRLRHASAALSERITNVLTVLANTRAEVLSTPATTFPKDSRDVPYEDLLTYAKKISKFTTVPPNLRSSVAAAAAAAAAGAPQPASSSSSASSPPPRDDEQRQQQQQQEQEQGGETGQDAEEQPRGEADTPMEIEERGIAVVASVAAEEEPRQEMRPAVAVVGHAFTPWPADDKIRRGALARIQGMFEAGEDPSLVVVVGGGMMVEGDESMAAGREERQVRDDLVETRRPLDDTVDREMTTSTQRREPVPVREEKPAVFGGLDLYDPDED
ncbi:MAG: hypothetical protein M1816_001895 [Peltula sp. TS41687]|nr:MAG: hypothetical protein M1816_001895 [Peltula sp. TS41687]